jgi:hypothetical protein
MCCPLAGAGAPVLVKAAAYDAAWTEMQRGAAWWLGEFVNVAAGEVAGQPHRDEDNGHADVHDPSRISSAEAVALQVDDTE